MCLILSSYAKADDLDHWRAPYDLAMMHWWGQAAEQNCSAASDLMRRFIEGRYHYAEQLESAEKSLEAGDAWGALVQYLLLSEQGSEAGSANAAFMLERGWGSSHAGRFDDALDLYLSSGKLGNPQSIVAAGNLLYFGDLYKLNDGPQVPVAAELYQLAADMGDFEACYCLGWMYQHGEGVDKDLSLASDLFSRAVDLSPSQGIAVPSMLALFTLRLTVWIPALEPLLLQLAACVRALIAWKSGVRAPDAVSFAAPGREGVVKSMLTRLGATFGADFSSVNEDSLYITALAVVLACVTWMRFRGQHRRWRRLYMDNSSNRGAQQGPANEARERER